MFTNSFGSYRVVKQTNTQTDVAENIQRSSLHALRRWVINVTFVVRPSPAGLP